VNFVSQLKNRVPHAALAMLLLSGITACATGPAKAPAEEQADRETAARVTAALDADKLLYARHITVRADNGVVRLGGFVWSDSDLHEAERIAGLVPGVTRVIDAIELDRNSNDNNGVTR
jgi:osmotically-inducible protein OsmY